MFVALDWLDVVIIVLTVAAAKFGVRLLMRRYFGRRYFGQAESLSDFSIHAYPECKGGTQVRMFEEDGVTYREFQCLGSCGTTLVLPYYTREGCG